MIPPLHLPKFETDQAGRIIYPVDNGEPLSNDTEHLKWITFLKNGLEDWYGDRPDVFIAADLLWYPEQGRPDLSKAPDVMVVLDHPAGDRSSYLQWEENDRPPNVVFEFISKSNTASEMLGKLAFYSGYGCDEFYAYDYRRGEFFGYQRSRDSLLEHPPSAEGTWRSPILGMTFGLDESGALWVRRPDGKLVESHRQTVARAEAEAQRADAEAKRAEAEATRAEAEAKRASLLEAKLRELGIDPSSI